MDTGAPRGECLRHNWLRACLRTVLAAVVICTGGEGNVGEMYAGHAEDVRCWKASVSLASERGAIDAVPK